jgi:hypothetical protein
MTRRATSARSFKNLVECPGKFRDFLLLFLRTTPRIFEIAKYEPPKSEGWMYRVPFDCEDSVTIAAHCRVGLLGDCVCVCTFLCLSGGTFWVRPQSGRERKITVLYYMCSDGLSGTVRTHPLLSYQCFAIQKWHLWQVQMACLNKRYKEYQELVAGEVFFVISVPDRENIIGFGGFSCTQP